LSKILKRPGFSREIPDCKSKRFAINSVFVPGTIRCEKQQENIFLDNGYIWLY